MNSGHPWVEKLPVKGLGQGVVYHDEPLPDPTEEPVEPTPGQRRTVAILIRLSNSSTPFPTFGGDLPAAH